MSVSNSKQSTSKKKSSTKSNHNPEIAAAVATEISTVTSAPVQAPVNAPPHDPAPPPAPTPVSSAIALTASQAIAALDELEAKLGLNIVVSPNDKAQMRALARVSDTAISLASDIVKASPDRFPDFAGLPAASAYVQAVGPLATRAQDLASHVGKSVLNQRTPAALQTLALYAVAKGLGRITNNEVMREKVSALKAEVRPKHVNPKPKVTKAEKTAKRAADALKKKLAKATKLIAESGSTAPAVSDPAPAPAGASPAPQASPSPAAPAAAVPSNGAPPAPPPTPPAH